jgi:CspA family cold shock protein
VFVHITAVERAGMDGLQEGQTLNYDLEQGQRGRVSAINLKAE